MFNQPRLTRRHQNRNRIKSDNIVDSSVAAVDLASAAVTTAKVADAAITPAKMAPGALAPVGTIHAYGGTSAPTGYLVCDGSVVSQTTYADLFAAIGITYGPGDEVEGTFHLPDLTLRLPIGAYSGEGGAVGDAWGATTATLSTSNLPSHTHAFTTGEAGAHSHTILGASANGAETTDGTDGEDPTGELNLARVYTNTTSTAGAHTHTGTTDATGSGIPFSIMPPILNVLYIIKH